MSKIFIKNGTIIDPSTGYSGLGVLVVNDGKIVAVEKDQGVVPATTSRENIIIDATNQWIVPGLIDAHVHLREPGYEWKETIQTGVEAAISGGYTSVMCMPNTSPAIHSVEVVHVVLDKAKRANLTKVLPIGAVTFDRHGKQMAPLLELAAAGCVAFSDDGDPVYNGGIMRRALQIAASLKIPICCHEEDCSISCGGAMDECGHSHRMGILGWPAVAEEVLIARDIELARDTGGHVHICHISTARGALLVKRAKEDGINVTAEVTPHHLHLSHNDVDGIDTNYKMSPPLRSEEDVEALRNALNSGVLDIIASDHAPHERDSKELEFVSATMGITGLQTNLSLTMDLVKKGILKKERAIDALSSKVAKVFSLNSGTFSKSSAADITIFSPDKSFLFDNKANRSKSINSPFLGKEIYGVVSHVFVDGKLKFLDADGTGSSGQISSACLLSSSN